MKEVPAAPLDLSEQVHQLIVQHNYHVTAADIAVGAGISLTKSASVLNRIAADSQAVLEVTEAGALAYKFKPGLPGFREFPWKRLLSETAQALGQICFVLLKVSLGLFIIMSFLVILSVAIMVLLLLNILALFSGNAMLDFNALGAMLDAGNISMFFGLVVDAVDGNADAAKDPASAFYAERDPNRGFVYNTYQFLFGEGNPNCDLQDRRAKSIACLVRNNGGAIISEQLKPYAGSGPDGDDELFQTLLALNGEPVVTECGNIIYVFPEIMQTAHDQLPAVLSGHLVERSWRFAGVPYDQLFPVYCFAAISASIIIWFPWLWLTPYAILTLIFVLVPISRLLRNSIENTSIAWRNDYRRVWANMLEDPDEELAQKLAERKLFQQNESSSQSLKIAYSTAKDSLEQQIENHQ